MAADAVAVFSNLCIPLFTGEKAEIDEARFSISRLSPKTVKQIKPNLAGQSVWDVSGTQTGVHMLVHYDPVGICVVEVAQAKEGALREEYESLVGRMGKTLAATPERKDQSKEVDGRPVLNSMWRFKQAKGDILLALTTYPEPKFLIQHVMSISYVR